MTALVCSDLVVQIFRFFCGFPSEFYRFDIQKLGPEVIKKSCSTQLSMKNFMLIMVKMPTIVGILTVMSMKNCILRLPEPEKAEFLYIFLCL